MQIILSWKQSDPRERLKTTIWPSLYLPKRTQTKDRDDHYQFSSVAQLWPTLFDPMDCSKPGFSNTWTAACQASLSITNSRSPPKPMSIESVMPSSHLILCRPLLLLPSIFPTIRVFSNESALCIRWPKYWSFSFNISPSNEHPGLISFRMDWLDLLAVQGTLKSLLQHHSSNASILLCSAFFIVQLLHPYMTTGKTIALTRPCQHKFLGDKSNNIHKVCLVKAMVFPVVMYGCESWTIKKAEHRRIDAFELWCWRRLLRVPWTARKSNQSILKRLVLGIHW